MQPVRVTCGRRVRATRSRHGATCALRVPICDAAVYLEETQQLDVRGVRILLRHVRQQRLLGSGGRELRKLPADSAAAAMGAQCVQQL